MDPEKNVRRQIEDLHALLDISRAMAATTDLDSLLEMITTRAAQVLDAERGTLFLYEPDRQVLRSRIAQGAEEITFPVTRGIAGEVARSGRPLNVPDAYEDPRFNREVDRQTGFRTRNILALPLFGFDGGLVGVLEILNKRSGQFDRYDESVAGALSAQAGVALQRARLQEHYQQKLRIEREIEIARQVQADLLPAKDPELPGFDIAGWNCSCDRVGGDCYDFFPLGHDRLAIGLGDAAGHGIGPALVSVEARALLRGLATVTDDLHRIINSANLVLAHDLDPGRFVTMFFGVLDARLSCLEYASAGQSPILFFDSGRAVIRQLEATGMPLGMMGDMEIPVATPLAFRQGDVLALLTDGLFEWSRADGAYFGVEGVSEAIVKHADQPAAKILGSILAALYAFADTPQSDDLTLVVVKKL